MTRKSTGEDPGVVDHVPPRTARQGSTGTMASVATGTTGATEYYDASEETALEKSHHAQPPAQPEPMHPLAKTVSTVSKSDMAGVAAVAPAFGVGVTPQLAMEASEGPAGAPGVVVVAPEAPEHARISTARTVAIVTVATMASALGGAGSMALSIALPKIGEELDIPDSQLQWVSSAFALTNGCFLLLAGRVADVYGRKVVFVSGIGWNALWTFIGGFMNNPAALIVTRALAGVGSALSIPSAIGIIASSFHGRTRSSAFAAFSAGGPIGGGLGLIVGGVLVEYTDKSWRAALWAFAAAAALVAVAGFFVVLPDRNLDPDRRIDYIGGAIITIGLVLLQFAISDGEDAPQGWKSGYIIALLIISVLMVVGFFFWEHYVETRTTRPPLMRLGLWTRANGRLAATYIIGGISWMGFATMFFNATLFYQQVQLTGTIGAMLRFMPTFICGLICNVIVAKIVHLVNNQLLICIGIAATGLANVFFAVSPADGIYWGLPFNAMWLSVVGADFLMAVGSIFVSTLALPEEQSVAGAIFQTLIQLGGALGLAFVGVVQTSIKDKEMAKGVEYRPALLKGLHGAFWFAAGSSFASLIIAAVVLRGMGRFKPHKKAASEISVTTDATAYEAPLELEGVRADEEKAEVGTEKR